MGEEDNRPLPRLCYGDERRESKRKFQIIVLTVSIIVVGLATAGAAVYWARHQVIGTNLPLPPYSVDEASGRVLK